MSDTENGVMCEYVSTADETGVRGCDGEVVDGDVVYCTAEAELVLRPPNTHGLKAAMKGKPGPIKRVFCRAHGRYLQRPKTDDEREKMRTPPRPWEQCGENPKGVINAR